MGDVTVKREAALSNTRDVVALWYVDQSTAVDIVHSACNLLVAGFDGPSLRLLSAVSTSNADQEVPELLEPALDEVGLTYYLKSTPAAHHAGLAVMASRVLTGALAPRALAAWVHRTFGHTTLAAAEHLAELDDAYDTLEHTNLTADDVNAEVLTEARRITAIAT